MGMNSKADSKNLSVKSCGPDHFEMVTLRSVIKEQRQTPEFYKSELSAVEGVGE